MTEEAKEESALVPQPTPAATQVLMVGHHCPERAEKHRCRSVGPPKTHQTTVLVWDRNTGAWRTPSSDALLDGMAIISCAEMFRGARSGWLVFRCWRRGNVLLPPHLLQEKTRRFVGSERFRARFLLHSSTDHVLLRACAPSQRFASY